MKKSAKQLGDQFEKLSQKEMNYGREKVRKGIGLEDLTSKEQKFWNKGTKKMVGRKLSKKLVQKWRERVFKLKGLKRTQENEWSYSTTTPNKMHSCEISKFLGLNREIPKASREWGKQLHKRIKTLILFHSSSGSRKTKEQCFSTLRKRNCTRSQSSIKWSTVQILSKGARFQKISFSNILSEWTSKGCAPPKWGSNQEQRHNQILEAET